MDRTLKVIGKGHLSVKPDTIEIAMNINGKTVSYSQAVDEVAFRTNNLKLVISELGVKRDEIKTVSFSINTDYESYKEKGEYKQRFVGYRYNHRLSIKLPLESNLINQVFDRLRACSSEPEFYINYTVADVEKQKNAVLQQAVIDSQRKASLMATTLGAILGKVQSIDYSWGQIDVYSNMSRSYCLNEDTVMVDGSFGGDITPEDIDIDDTVTVIWELV